MKFFEPLPCSMPKVRRRHPKVFGPSYKGAATVAFHSTLGRTDVRVFEFKAGGSATSLVQGSAHKRLKTSICHVAFCAGRTGVQ